MCVRVREYSYELEDVLEYAHILEYRYVHKGGHSAVGRGNFGVQVPVPGRWVAVLRSLMNRVGRSWSCCA